MNTGYISNEKLRAVLFSVLTLLLASCGGGGSSEPAIDTIPASFSFTEQSEAELETDRVSSVITVSGINAKANISIDGGEYSVNGGSYTSAAAMISNGQQIRVRHTSSTDFSTMMTTTLTIGGVSSSFSSTTLAIDTTPASFSFTEQSEAELNTNSLSNVITVSGINTYANISIDGGEYSINGGVYTSATAVISNGQQIRVRHTSSADFSTMMTTTLTIAGVSGSFSSTTLAIDTAPASFAFTEQPDVELNTDSFSNVITVSGINAYANISIDDGEYSINGDTYTSTANVISNGQQVRVKHTSSADYNTATTTTLTIGGISGSFSSTTWAIDTTPASFVFTEQSAVELNSDNISNVITVSGINAFANISIEGGEYSIDGGAYTSTTTVISNGQQVRVQHTSSADYNTETATTLTIGDMSGSFTTLTIPQFSFITGCTELYGADCTNVDDWTATLWQDDLSEVLAERSFSENAILRFPEAYDKETVNYSVSGTVSVVDNTRKIGVYTFLGVNAKQTYTFSTTELGFPVPEAAPLNSDCETFTLAVNGIPVGDEQSLAVKMYNPNSPHLPVFFERTNLLDTDSSQDYTVTSCDNVVLVILSANGAAYAEFDTANIAEGGNGSVTLLIPSTVTVNADRESSYFLNTHLGRAVKKGTLISPWSDTLNQYIFSPEAAGLVTYDYQARESCPLISDVSDLCLNDARRLNDTTAASTVNLTFANFSITQFDLNMDDRQLDVNWIGAETPTAFILGRSYSGNVNGESISLYHWIKFSATTLSTVIPPLPNLYQSWLENGDITLSLHYLILENNEKFSALSFSEQVISEHTVSGAQFRLSSPEVYRKPRQILIKFPE